MSLFKKEFFNEPLLSSCKNISVYDQLINPDKFTRYLFESSSIIFDKLVSIDEDEFEFFNFENPYIIDENSIIDNKLTKKEFYDARRYVDVDSMNRSNSTFNVAFNYARKNDSSFLSDARSVLKEYNEENNTNCIAEIYFRIPNRLRFGTIDNKPSFTDDIIKSTFVVFMLAVAGSIFPSLANMTTSDILGVGAGMYLLNSAPQGVINIKNDRTTQSGIIDDVCKKMTEINRKYIFIPSYGVLKTPQNYNPYAKELVVRIYAYKKK